MRYGLEVWSLGRWTRKYKEGSWALEGASQSNSSQLPWSVLSVPASDSPYGGLTLPFPKLVLLSFISEANWNSAKSEGSFALHQDPLSQHTWQVLTLICRVITTEGAHSCRWVFLGLGMWGQWLGEGQQELENEQSTGYLEERETLHTKGTCDLSREQIFTTWPLKKHMTWITCEGIYKGRTVLIQ